jgi:hypothetical protein
MQQRIVIGDTLSFTTSVPDYPASDGWVLKHRLVPRSGAGAAIVLTGAADADDPSLHLTEVAAATTAGWTAGQYSWASYVEQGTQSYTLSTGSVELLANPRTSTAPLDLRTQAEVALAAAKAAYAAWTPTTRSYTIGNRSMTFSSRAEIVQTIEYWEIEVQREQRELRLAKGLADPRKTYVRVNRA